MRYEDEDDDEEYDDEVEFYHADYHVGDVGSIDAKLRNQDDKITESISEFFHEDEDDEEEYDDEVGDEDYHVGDVGPEDAKLRNQDDRMTELISLQKSNGSFEISQANWAGSVFELHTGKFQDVESNRPAGITINVWMTALAFKILELEMATQKDMWELVARKSKNYILLVLKEDQEQLKMLLNNAEEYIFKQ